VFKIKLNEGMSAMPINIPENLPAKSILESENIFVMTEKRAITQDIRPLKILIVNLMPTKITTETQLLRLLGNTPIQIEPDFLHMESHVSKHTPIEHLMAFYSTFNEIKDKKYDGMIVTGAPVETLPFEEVDYWDELTRIFDWAEDNVTSNLYICWAAQAALYHKYKINKYTVGEKIFGVFKHTVIEKRSKLLRGFDDVFLAPHSRHTQIDIEDVKKVKDLLILATSEEAGVYLIASRDGRHIFTTGHSEYDCETLDQEYKRDLEKGLPIKMPKNYYPNDDPNQTPVVSWRAHAHLLFNNWLNYFVYQETPYDLYNQPIKKSN